MRSGLFIALTMGAFLGGSQASADTYGYDELGRLISVTLSDGNRLTYQYDAAGNRIQVATLPPLPTVGNVALTVPYNTAGSVALTPSGSYTSLAVVTQPNHGVATINGSTATFTPANAYYGSDSFTYNAIGTGGSSVPATVSVTVSTPAVPTVSNKALSVAYNKPGTVDLTPGGVYSSVAVASAPGHGSVSISGTTATFTPTNGYSGTDSFTFKAAGPGGTSNAATVNVTIGNAPNPTPKNDTASTAFRTNITIGVLGNDTDPNQLSLSLVSVTNPSNGTAVISGSNVVYSPSNTFSGSDSFTYTVSNGHGGTASGSVTVTVGNGTPSATADAVTTGYNTTKTFDPRPNDTDPNGDTLSVTSVTSPGHGTNSYSASSVTYTPANGYIGADSFNYTVSDGRGGTSSAAVNITVSAPPQPVAQDTLASGQGLLPGMSLKSGNNLYSLNMQTDGNLVVYGPSGATWNSGTYGKSVSMAIMQADGNLVLYSSAGQTFWSSATSGHSGSSLVMQSDGNLVIYSPTNSGLWATNTANTAPVAVNDTTQTAYVTEKTIDPRTNDTDANGDALTVSGVSAAKNGQTSYTSSSVKYVPNTSFSGTDTFTYTIVDGKGGSATATVTVSVANAPPVAVNDSVTTAYSTPVTLDPRANDSDPNGNPLTITSVTNAAKGSLSYNGTSITYTPSQNYGADSFNYTISDGQGGSATGTVAVTIGIPPAPTVGAKSLSAPYNTASTIVLTPNGSYTSIAIASNPAHGAVSVSGLTVTYTPTAGYSGSDSFTYTGTGPGGTSAPATVSVTVQPQSVISLSVTSAANLRSVANSAGYNPNAIYQFVVPSGVTVMAAANGGPAVDTGTWPAGTKLSLIVNGNIYGRGGNGGSGGTLDDLGTAGTNGGDAIFVQAPIEVTINAGASVRGGGGGGGGGGVNNSLDASGGGGGGFPNGVAGPGLNGPSSNGAAGTTSGGGRGGPGKVNSLSGGAGGGAGQPGVAGSGRTGPRPGGEAGYAIRKNGVSVTVSNAGTISGIQG